MSVLRLFGRRQRRWLSLWQVVAMLFTQLAVAAYICPTVSAATLLVAAPAAPDCAAHGKAVMDPVQPQLCKAHCVAADQVVGGAAPAGAAAAPLLLAVLDWRIEQLALAAAPRERWDRLSGAPPPGTPPLYLSLLVLRQ